MVYGTPCLESDMSRRDARIRHEYHERDRASIHAGSERPNTAGVMTVAVFLGGGTAWR